MKIQKLTFQNLNSLYGVWEIDFSDKVFTESGIFAITGPTGSGKSTILDAICLALYGETPRLSRISKSTNELMSRRTGECFAELQFETNKGSYICRWSQRRARSKAEGELQQPKHEISLSSTGVILEEKIMQVKAKVEEVTGMDFTRFTRSMLLAQGGFDVFLKAEMGERSSILEEITGTDIYSDISKEVHIRKSALQNKHKELTAVLGAITILDAEECQALRDELSQATEAATKLQKDHGEITAMLKWAENIKRLQGEIRAHQSVLEAVHKDVKDFGPQRKQLEKMQRAIPLKAEFKGIETLRERLKEINQDLEVLKARSLKLTQDEDTIKTELKQAATILTAAEEQNPEQQRVFTLVRQLDSKLSDQQKALSEISNDLKKRSSEYMALEKDIRKMEEELGAQEKELSTAKKYQKENSADAELPSSYKALNNQLLQVMGIEKEIKLFREKGKQADPGPKKIELATFVEKIAALSKELEQTDTKIGESGEALQKLLAGKSLAEHRKQAQAEDRKSSQIQSLCSAFENYVKQQTRFAQLKAAIAKDNEDLKQIESELKSKNEKLAVADQTLQTETNRKQQADRILDLKEERKKLQDNSPCPLCGSTQHPFATGLIPDLEAGDQALKEARQAVKDIERAITELNKLQTETTTRLRLNKESLAEIDMDAKAEELGKKRAQFGVLEISTQVLDKLQKLNAKNLETMGKLIKDAEELAQKQEELKEEKTQLQSRLATLQEQRGTRELALHKLQTEADQYARDLNDLQDKIFVQRRALAEQIKPFGIDIDALSNLPEIASTLAAKQKAWTQNSEQVSKLGAEIQRLRASISAKEEWLKNRKQEIDAAKAKQTELNTEIEGNTKARHKLLGADKVDEAEAKWQSKLAKLRAELKETELKNTENKANISTNTESRQRITEQLSGHKLKLQEAETEFLKALQENSFSGLEDFQSSLLSQEQLNQLQDREKELSAAKEGLTANIMDKTRQLQLEQEKKLTDIPLVELEPQAKAHEAEIAELNKEQGALATKLRDNETQQKTHARQIEKIAAHKTILERWEKLSELIGSADGKKYRTFAQGITFELLISRANDQLKRLSDRYLLINEDDAPLDLFIVDHYQGGEIRTVKNLSGGESFLVSLALALGLSKMSSKNVSIDSLFLDEGFGSLDEDSLETALVSLAAMNNEGKLIGLISHVAAIKDRIPNQIQIVPQTGGISEIKGMGCRKIEN